MLFSSLCWGSTDVPLYFCLLESFESYQRLKKMLLDATLLNTRHYKVRIEGKVE